MTLQKFLKGIIYTSLAIVPMLAWYVSDSTFFPFITGKNFAFRFLIEISFLAWIVLAAIEPAYRPHKSIVFYSYSAFLLVLFIANLLGVNPYLSFFSNYERMEGWFTHLHLFFYFTVLYSVYKTDKDWSKMLGWFSISAIAVTIEGFMQLMGQKDFFLTRFLSEKLVTIINTAYPTHMGGGLRLDSSLGNAAYYGIYTAFFAFIFALVAMRTNKWKGGQGWGVIAMFVIAVLMVLSDKFIMIFANDLAATNMTSAQSLAAVSGFVSFIGLIAMIFTGYNIVKKYVQGDIGAWPFILFSILNMFALIYTQTRGSQLGFLIGAFVSALLVAVIGRKTNKKFSRIAFSAVGVFVLAFAVFITMKNTVAGQAFIDRTIILKRLATIKVPSLTEMSNSIKSETYPEMVNTFGEATIVSRILNAKMSIEGWQETPKTLLLGYGQENYSTVFAKHYDPRMYAQEAWFDRAHNVFMDWLVAGGLLGLITYLALYLTSIYMLWYAKGRNNIGLVEKALLTGALVMYFINNLFVFDNLISYVIFIALLAYIAARTRTVDSLIKNEDKSKHFFNNAHIYGGLVVGLIISGVLFTFTVIKPLSTNLDLISALRLKPTSFKDLTSSTEHTFNAFKQAIDRNTFGTGEAREQMLQNVATLQSINVSSMDKGELEKFKNVMTQYKTYAESELEKMTTTDTKNARNLSLYGTYLRVTGQPEKALNYISQASELAPHKQIITMEYISTLLENKKFGEALALAERNYKDEPTFKEAKDLYESMKALITSTTTKQVK